MNHVLECAGTQSTPKVRYVTAACTKAGDAGKGKDKEVLFRMHAVMPVRRRCGDRVGIDSQIRWTQQMGSVGGRAQGAGDMKHEAAKQCLRRAVAIQVAESERRRWR